MRRVRSLLVLVSVAMVLVAGCAPTVPVVDTWRVGEEIDCRDMRCRAAVDEGLRGLGDREPGHAPVASVSMHRVGSCIDPATGDAILQTRSGGGIDVLLVRLTDGTTHAIGVGYPGISTVPVVFAWDTAGACR